MPNVADSQPLSGAKPCLPRATRPVFASTGVDAALSLSPDGRHLAFISARGGMRQLWLGELGHTPQTLSTQRGNFSTPHWHPCGTCIPGS